MKSLLVIFLITFSIIQAGPITDLSFLMGGMSPNQDVLTQQSFGKNYTWQAALGVMDDSGWELRGAIGHYGDISHHPVDLGYDLTLSILPLTASLIYHLSSPVSFFQPYVGLGAGAYFYDVKNNVYSALEAGTRFGIHALGGIKFNLFEGLYAKVEYTQHYLQPVFFTNANNFNAASLAIGIGLQFPMNGNNKAATAEKKYRYTSYEEDLLVQIQQATTELNEMRNKRLELSDEIDTFYSKYDYDESNEGFKQLYQHIKFQESKMNTLDRQISTAQTNLTSLQQQWQTIKADNQPVEQHITYLTTNFDRSPYDLSYQRGFLVHGRRPYSYRYYRDSIITPPVPRHTVNQQAPNTGTTVEEKKEYAEKKKAYLLQLKNRTLN